MPKQICFLLFYVYGFICEFLKFPLVKFSKVFTAFSSCGIQILNMKKVGLVQVTFSTFANLSFTAAKKTGLIDFPEKMSPD